jgi:hypothetical protein
MTTEQKVRARNCCPVTVGTAPHLPAPQKEQLMEMDDELSDDDTVTFDEVKDLGEHLGINHGGLNPDLEQDAEAMRIALRLLNRTEYKVSACNQVIKSPTARKAHHGHTHRRLPQHHSPMCWIRWAPKLTAHAPHPLLTGDGYGLVPLGGARAADRLAGGSVDRHGVPPGPPPRPPERGHGGG